CRGPAAEVGHVRNFYQEGECAPPMEQTGVGREIPGGHLQESVSSTLPSLTTNRGTGKYPAQKLHTREETPRLQDDDEGIEKTHTQQQRAEVPTYSLHQANNDNLNLFNTATASGSFSSLASAYSP
ncbi:unnamed protein product, partial [Amoebophrya sp. A25]